MHDSLVEIGELILVETAAEWRSWLEANTGVKREIWLVNFKNGATGTSLDYDTALDEAVCFGWIDSMIRRIDDERYATRWTPRRPRSRWTAANLARAQRMISAGRMAPAGLATLPADRSPAEVRRDR